MYSIITAPLTSQTHHVYRRGRLGTGAATPGPAGAGVFTIGAGRAPSRIASGIVGNHRSAKNTTSHWWPDDGLYMIEKAM